MDPNATVKIAITEGGKKYPERVFSLKTTGDTTLYSWNDLQQMDPGLTSNTYNLGCDIGFPEPGEYGFPEHGFEPIGTEADEEFYANFNGSNRVIRNFYINADKKDSPPKNIGMFQRVNFLGNISGLRIGHLTFEDPTIIAGNTGSYDTVGVLAGLILDKGDKRRGQDIGRAC